MITTEQAKRVLETLLFVTEDPLSEDRLREVFENNLGTVEIRALLEDLRRDYESRDSSLEVREIAGGWQLATRSAFAHWVRKLYKDRLTYRLSTSAMETLSIVAYKQPITRSEIEEIRGVEVTAVLETLLERRLVKIAGRKETIGRPLLYVTTPDFLRAFNLKRLEDLPSVEELVPPQEEGIATAGERSDGEITEAPPEVKPVDN